MYWILVVMGGIVAVVGALLVGGLLSSPSYRVSRTLLLRTTPVERVWALVRTVDAYHAWHANAPYVEWVAEQPLTALSLALRGDDMALRGSWTWSLSPVERGSSVTLVEAGHSGNLIVRFVRTQFFGFGAGVDDILQALATACGEAAAAAP